MYLTKRKKSGLEICKWVFTIYNVNNNRIQAPTCIILLLPLYFIIFITVLVIHWYFFVFQIEDVKPEGSEHINLKVTGQDGSVVHFKIKRNTPLRKLMSAYCDRAVSLLYSSRNNYD